ncbi:class I SAM-dependent methyltransferase [Bremerella cremea]|uniref:Class I SAM-dependent methyltransferase n=1 Tax=Bremerella cremea TaxID=1031537 RepID=A0A368KNL9_9BACT|nr:class I SAM-dependent methyltransferase [Bremerella cremea]RCS46057.1 class I SAM-dependent methyltransferase [Bremerella cremea]
MPDTLDLQAGHQIYTRKTLALYDVIVHRFSNHWLWNCPTAKLQAWFERHVTDNHLDVGVGTGFFLERCTKWTSESRIGLLDANENCLHVAEQRIAPLQAEVIHANLAEPFSLQTEPFQSLSLMYVLHCLPGDAAFRKRVIGHCATSLLPGGQLFGATILGQPQPRGWLGRRVMASYNRKGIFGNADDTKDALAASLSDSLHDIEIEQIGSVALFSGVRP